ncbi:bone morphogenetic protein 5 [Platysternon megacephalum]|uniref:Bone morphogenetic protein 5 n=1 Tax=Platysternon megacephalum TaxID=55544 RepID=A0A4D9EG04_9SAUR|nr:bone morphogenetic protein 5 [Platysternon megacephalum]
MMCHQSMLNKRISYVTDLGSQEGELCFITAFFFSVPSLHHISLVKHYYSPCKKDKNPYSWGVLIICNIFYNGHIVDFTSTRITIAFIAEDHRYRVVGSKALEISHVGIK